MRCWEKSIELDSERGSTAGYDPALAALPPRFAESLRLSVRGSRTFILFFFNLLTERLSLSAQRRGRAARAGKGSPASVHRLNHIKGK